MRRTLPLALAALTLSTATAAPAADDLFSEVTIESVFGGSAGSTTTKTASSDVTATRVTGAGQLGELLRDAGMEPERIDAKAVKVTVEHGVWTIPTTLRAAVDRGQVEVTMGLATPEKGSDKLAAKRLLSLLSTAPGAGGAYFAFDRQIGQIQLKQTLSARGVTSDRLRRMLTEMAELAASRETDWYEEPKQTASTPSQKASAAPVGTWIATLSQNEAFALRIASGGDFSLAHVKAGRTTKSSGKATRVGAQLRLADVDGKSITGTISGESAGGFELSLAGGRKLSFKKAG